MATAHSKAKIWCASKQTYAAIVGHYSTSGPGFTCSLRDYALELKWFTGQSSLRKAVARASIARSMRGQRLSHQRCVSRQALFLAHNALTRNLAQIRNCVSFVDIHTLVDSLTRPIKGIGSVYIYDTALRIAHHHTFTQAHLPVCVYLHSGSLEGARNIQILKHLHPRRPTAQLPTSFPHPISTLAAFEIENLLYVYRDCLQ
jgi:hypothetical protein